MHGGKWYGKTLSHLGVSLLACELFIHYSLFFSFFFFFIIVYPTIVYIC